MIADLANLKIIDIKFNECNGGSFRIYFAKRSSDKYVESTELINSILENETRNKLRSKDTYIKFMEKCDSEIAKLKRFIDLVNKNGQSVYIYGASTKGNCLLQYANITESDIKYAVERNLNKVGKMTSTGIPIISEEEMRQSPPDFLLVLPWHFRDEIIKRESTFLNNGGQFIFPLPNFEIYSSKKRLLITGCDGFISSYIKGSELFKYNLYGIGRSNYKYENGILKSYFDMNNTEHLENFLSIVKPDIIIHLASLSSSSYAFYNPIETLYTNGMLVAHLCDIIHRNNWNTILFNAVSSDMYKGHERYMVSEDDTHKYHDHPYSIAKIMGSSIVDFYRKTYNYNFSNGIIFTTESKDKGDNFLLKKISNHIKDWKSGNRDPLEIGNLDSYRNIIHVSDVVSAIHTIINQNRGDTYLICNDNGNQMRDYVEKMYVSWYYFNKFQESEQNYRNLYYQFEKVHIDNKNMKIRIQDLESYRNDISKTFNVLDKELLVINDHLQSRNNNDNITKTGSGSANVQIITPELINSLLDKSENEDTRVNDLNTNENNRVNDLNTNEDNRVNDLNTNEDTRVNDLNTNENNRVNDLNTNEDTRVNDLNTNEDTRVNDLNTIEDKNKIYNVSEMEDDLQGNLENGDYHSDVELEHLNFRLGDSYNRFLINN